MIDDCAYEEKRKHLIIMASFFVEFVSKVFNSYDLIVGEESVGENVVDDV